MRRSPDLFAADPDRARHELGELLASDPAAFRAAIIPVLRQTTSAAYRDCVKLILARGGLLPLCDPGAFSLEEEIGIVRELAAADPAFDLKLARRFSVPGESMPDEVAMRLLDLLGAICTTNRVLPLIVRLLQDPHPRLQSKAALLIARANMAPQTAAQLLMEGDARVRANAVEALWGCDTPLARGLFREGARDVNNRVVGNALLGLYLIGDTSAIPQILRMGVSADPLFRATAAWVMARTGNPRFLPVLKGLVKNSRPGARNRVFQAITTLKNAAARLAAAPALRVHLLAAGNKPDGLRLLHAAIAAGDGAAIEDLPATGVVVTEDRFAIVDYSVQRLPVPERIALGLFFPEGEPGDRIVATLTEIKRERDRWSVVRHHADSVLPLLHQAFGSLGSIGLPRHAFIYAGKPPDPTTGEGDIAVIVKLARASGVVLHSVSIPGEEASEGCQLARRTGGYVIPAAGPEHVVPAYERLYLGLLNPYEIFYQPPTGTVLPAEITLEIFGPAGQGSSSLRPGAPATVGS
jgi:hypothetical protein